MTAPAASHQKAATRILLVEDDVFVRLMTFDLLVEFGYEVVEASTGAEARELFANRPDIVITDINLPDIDGLDLASEFRAMAPGVPIIIASGNAAAPGVSYIWLQKPFRSTGLQDAITRALLPE